MLFFILFLSHLSSSKQIDGNQVTYARKEFEDDEILQIVIPDGKVCFLSFSTPLTFEKPITVDSQSRTLNKKTEYSGFELHCNNFEMTFYTTKVYAQMWFIDNTTCHGTSHFVQGTKYHVNGYSFTQSRTKAICLFIQSSFRAQTIIQNVKGEDDKMSLIYTKSSLGTNAKTCTKLDCVNAIDEEFFIVLNGSVNDYDMTFKYYKDADPIYSENYASSYTLIQSDQSLGESSQLPMKISISQDESSFNINQPLVVGFTLGLTTIVLAFVVIICWIQKGCITCNSGTKFVPVTDAIPIMSNKEDDQVVGTPQNIPITPAIPVTPVTQTNQVAGAYEEPQVYV